MDLSYDSAASLVERNAIARNMIQCVWAFVWFLSFHTTAIHKKSPQHDPTSPQLVTCLLAQAHRPKPNHVVKHVRL